MRCLKSIHDSLFNLVMLEMGNVMEKFTVTSQPCFHNFTGLFSMGHKDSEAL